MASRWAGKFLWLIIIALSLACVPSVTRDDSLNPKSLFSIGSSFLDNSSNPAIKGKIEFKSKNSIQTGSFILYLNSPDSLSFLIEGPFSTDVFRMIIIDTTAHILGAKGEGWREFRKGENIDIPDYGLENLSPFLIGLLIFPQYYLHQRALKENNLENDFNFNGENLRILWNDLTREFSLLDKKSGLSSSYSEKKSVANGYYPSNIRIAGADKSWLISLHITKIALNKEIPTKAWLID